MNIEKIIFYRTDDKEIRSLVFYENGSVMKKSYKDGVNLVLDYSKENGYKTIEDLKKDRNIKIWDNETYKSNIEKEIRKHQKRKYSDVVKPTDEDTNTEGKRRQLKSLLKRKNGKKKKTKKKRARKRSVLNWLIGIVLVSCIGTFAGIKRNYSNKFNETQKELEDEKNNSSNEEKTTSFSKARYDTNLNKSKKKVLNAIWDYISNYNKDVADNHTGNKTASKLSLKWDEAMADYLAFNSLNREEIVNLFDSYKFDSEKSLKAYKSAYNQEVLAHTVQTEALNKESLLKNQKQKDFYYKYESILISYNVALKDKVKLNYAEKFYKELRKDFDFKEIDSDSTYKLSVLPMVEAMNKMTKDMDLENKLSKSEKEYFNDLVNSKVIKSKFKKIENTLSSRQAVAEVLNEKEEKTNYSELRKLAIKELKEDDAYITDADDRDITDHKEYKQNVAYHLNIKKSTKTNNGNKDSQEKTSKSLAEQAVNKTVKKVKAVNKVDSKETDKKLDNIIVEEKNVVKDIVTTDKDNGSNDNINDDDYYIKPDTEQDFENDNNSDNNDNNTIIDNDVTDITNDSTGAVDADEPLPDANEEDTQENTDKESSSLITVTYINPDVIDATENYQATNNNNNEINESVATPTDKEQTSSNSEVKVLTK